MKRKRILLLIIMALAFILSFFSSNEKRINASESTFSVDFDNENNYEDFTPFYVSSGIGTDGMPTTFEENFKQESGYIQSIRSHSNGSTDNNMYLSLTSYKFANFEANLVGRYVENGWGWFGITYRQQGLGFGALADGAFAGMEQECYSLIWGSPNQNEGSIEGKEVEGACNKKEWKRLNVKVVGDTTTVKVYELDDTLVSQVSTTSSKNVKVDGFVSIASIDNNHDFKSFSITNLDDNGNPIPLVKASKGITSIKINNKDNSMSVGETKTLSYSYLPETESLDNIRLSSSDSNVIIAKGSSITAIADGNATIKVFNQLNMSVFDSFDVNVSGIATNTGKKEYNFSSLSSLDDFRLNFVANVSTPGGEVANNGRYWTFDDSTKSVVRANVSNPDPADDIASILLDGTFDNYEISLIYSNPEGANGWVGVIGGQTDLTKRFQDEGYAAFVQKEGYPTIWGLQTNGISENRNVSYDKTAWHILKVKVYNGTIEVFVDDLNNSLLKKSYGSSIKKGRCGVFASGEEIKIKTLSFAYLDKNGTEMEYFAVSSFKINNKITAGKVGQSVPLEYLFNDNASNKNVVLVSSDSNICIAKNDKLTFIDGGNVTITAYPQDNPDLVDTLVINVTKDDKQPSEIKIDDDSSDQEEPNTNNKTNNTIKIFNIVLLAINCLLIVAMTILFVLKKKGGKQ